MNEKNRERNPCWKDWYPSFIPDFSTVEVGKSPYGEPNPETLKLFTKLPARSVILDVGGGDGRYALPLAHMGYNVTVLDVDMAHLKRLQTNAEAVLPNTAGKIDSVLADATEVFPFHRQFDGVLNAGFGYLIPPDQLDLLFARMAKILKSGGLLVFEFATNRERHDINGKSLIGKQEYIYTYEEGLHILQSSHAKYGLKLMPPQTKTIDFETPYHLHNDLIIAHGIKQ
jgi:SAM-dependent methyltransferase